jgi:hypothetical protein
MERLTDTNILFLDACRDNPLARNLARSMGTRSSEIGRGLAQVEAGIGTLISFSTQPGNVALDGTGRNSPFAGALVKHMGSSNDDLSAILISVRNDVMKQTQRKQVPWEHSALTGRFYFNPTTQNTEPPKIEITRPAVSKAPPTEQSVYDRSRGAYDGNWRVARHGSGCLNLHASFSVSISRDDVLGGERSVTGTVDNAGKITFSHSSAQDRRVPVRYFGQLTGNSGAGRFVGAKRCVGSFTLTRQ